MTLRWALGPAIALLQTGLAAAAPDGLSDRLAPLLAASVYLPLWPLSALGLPVLSSAEAGGWAAPSALGWAVCVTAWATFWGLLGFAPSAIRRWHRR